jgi:transposase
MGNKKIVYQPNKKSGVIYAYANEAFWDAEKKQSRARRKLLGKVDPVTGEIIPTRGRGARSDKINLHKDYENVNADDELKTTTQTVGIGKILDFLKFYMCETLAKRLLCAILLVVGFQPPQIASIVGLSQKTVIKFGNAIENGHMNEVLAVSGGGRKRKLADVEAQVVADINNGTFHTRQQIADMVYEKYGIKVSLPAIGRIVKKTKSSD